MTPVQNSKTRSRHNGNTLVLLFTGILLGAGILCIRKKKQDHFREDRMWFI